MTSIPLVRKTDVVIVGGSTAAVAAAVAARQAGAEVLLISGRPYLGEDLCAHWRFDLNPHIGHPGVEAEDEAEDDEALRLAEAFPWVKGLFRPEMSPHDFTPMHIKRTLEDALLAAGIPFLFSTYPGEILLDAQGRPAGVTLLNRAGRQAVQSKVVIDATARADVARFLRGRSHPESPEVRFRPFPSGIQPFRRVVVGGDPRPVRIFDRAEGVFARGEGILACREIERPLEIYKDPVNLQGLRTWRVYEYTLAIEMPDDSFASYARAEQRARDLTWQPGQVGASDSLFQLPPDTLVGDEHIDGAWPGAQGAPIGAFRPQGVTGLFVLSGAADLSPAAAEALLSPPSFIALGARLGRHVAQEIQSVPELKPVRAFGRATGRSPDSESGILARGRIREPLQGLRASDQGLPKLDLSEELPAILGTWDVVVAGGGTGGAPAGIGAARGGARTLLCEYLPGLGGVGTLGMIGRYWFGNRVGFTAEIDQGAAELAGEMQDSESSTAVGATKAAQTGKPNALHEWDIESKMEWYRRQMTQAGGDVWFGAFCYGVLLDESGPENLAKICGVLVATPSGRGVILCRAAVDSTGNADLAAAAGAPCEAVDERNAAMQGTGLPPRVPGAKYTNTDHTFVDDSDVVDTTQAFVAAKAKFPTAFDLGQLVDTRERRRIAGEATVTPTDIYLKRSWPDTIVLATSNFDSHGFSVHPLFLLKPPDHGQVWVDVPYRALIPRNVEGLLVTGLGISAHRDAMPVIRMQADVQNQGYAAGRAAAQAAENGTGVRAVDVKSLQRHLAEKGNLPSRVLEDTDSLEPSAGELPEAVSRVPGDNGGAALLFAHPDKALPLLRTAYDGSGDAGERLAYAHVLAALGDARGLSDLKGAVHATPWDKGWNFKGMGQFGASLSRLDSLIIALGQVIDEEGVNIVCAKASDLSPASEFSHFRAVTEALESAPDAFRLRGAQALERLLRLPGLRGWAFTEVEDARRRTPAEKNDTTLRNSALIELHLARGLFRCGDPQGLGRSVLEEYACDMRGLFAGHARAVLRTK